MNLQRILGLRGRNIEVNLPSENSEENDTGSESELPSFPDTDSDLTNSFADIETMDFDPKEAREYIPELLGKNNFQQFMAICQDFKDSLGETPEAVVVKIIKRKLKNIEAFTLCRNATTFDDI